MHQAKCEVVRQVAAVLQSPRERARLAPTRLRLVGTLFGRASNVFMVAVAAFICGGAAWARGGHWISSLVAAIEVVLVLARCGVILAYQRRVRAGSVIDPDSWLAGFGLLAISSSLAWGVLSFIALASSHDPVLYVIPAMTAVGMAGAIAARNSGVPRLAKLQLVCSLTPILAGCLLADDHGFRLLLILIPALAAGLSIVISERNQQLVELIETQAELGRLSQTDALTQLPNRRSLDARLEYAAVARRSFSLLMVDVDNFKCFNDRYGHLAGDVLLCQIASILRQTLRGEGDVVARYGGEEFAVLLDHADAAHAAMVGERLRQSVESACRNPLDGATVTISVGCAVSASGHDAGAAMREADAALYRAKRAGRNRVEGAGCSSLAFDRAVA